MMMMMMMAWYIIKLLILLLQLNTTIILVRRTTDCVLTTARPSIPVAMCVTAAKVTEFHRTTTSLAPVTR